MIYAVIPRQLTRRPVLESVNQDFFWKQFMPLFEMAHEDKF